MEVKIISQELVKPSLPTPQHLRTFKLSLLDQLATYSHTPVILFYPMHTGPGPLLDVRRKIDLLKESLSRTLARFYPLAGKIWDGLSVECDDEGARFVEASVNMSLTQFLTDPDLVLLNRLIPCEFVAGESLDLSHPANIQVNVFECGGIALAICNTHKLHDGAALAVFLKEWTAFAVDGGGSTGSETADQDLGAAAELFPADDLLLRDLAITNWRSLSKTANCATKRFLFSGSAIEALKVRAKNSRVKNPTRVEAVSGLLWKCVMEASERKNHGHRRPSTFMQLVNIRRKMDPPLPGSSLGNLIWAAVGYCANTSSDSAGDPFPYLVGELRGAISGVDGNLLSGFSREPSFLSSFFKEMSGQGFTDRVDHTVCSSWCNFGFYDIDFGWGRPMWVSNIGLPGPPFLNFVILVDTRSGDGIEACVTLDEQEMALFQEDPELQSFASVNPSPLLSTSKH